MDWRRWDSLEQQSKPIITHHRMKMPIDEDVQPKESLTRKRQIGIINIADMPTRSEPFSFYVDNGSNLDPFREPRSKGWLSNEQYANLLSQRAVLQ